VSKFNLKSLDFQTGALKKPTVRVNVAGDDQSEHRDDKSYFNDS
jgi:hypothetical protein